MNTGSPTDSLRTNPSYWLLRFAPRRTSWVEIVARGAFTLRGVKSTVARKHLRGMALGDRVLFYQTEQNQAIVGELQVVRTAYPDPSSADAQWLTCDFAPVRSFIKPISLAAMKENALINLSPVVRQPRVAVLALTHETYLTIAGF